MTHFRLGLLSAWVLALACNLFIPTWSQAAPPWLQEGPERGIADDPDGEQDPENEDELDEDESEDEGEIDFSDEPMRLNEVPSGASENPTPIARQQRASGAGAGAATPATYPVELVLRPLTLIAGVLEVGIDIPVTLGPPIATGVFRSKYGVTDQIELGLRYSPGAVDDSGAFTAGRAVAIDGQYQITEWLAAQISLPILTDPLASGIVLGVPVRLRLGSRVVFFFGRDVLSVRFKDFVPVIEDPVGNEQRADLAANNTLLAAGELRLVGSGIYQVDRTMAILGEAGFIAAYQPYDSRLTATVALAVSPTDNVDIGLRGGFDDLEKGVDGLGTTLFLGLRL